MMKIVPVFKNVQGVVVLSLNPEWDVDYDELVTLEEENSLIYSAKPRGDELYILGEPHTIIDLPLGNKDIFLSPSKLDRLIFESILVAEHYNLDLYINCNSEVSRFVYEILLDYKDEHDLTVYFYDSPKFVEDRLMFM